VHNSVDRMTGARNLYTPAVLQEWPMQATASRFPRLYP
jgi:hypothetical protein